MFPISDSVSAPRFPVVNILIIAATIFVFVQQLLAPDPDAFVKKYALIPSLVDFRNYSTLLPFVTAIFLHGGFLHIISNLWFLWIFGDNVEGYFGSFFYPIVYLVCGIGGNLVQYFISPGSSIPMLGASGAIAGVLGAYYVLFPDSKIKTVVTFFFITIVDVPATLMLGYWFVLQIISGAVSLPGTSSVGGVAFFAHIGGFIAGVIFTKLFHRNESHV